MTAYGVNISEEDQARFGEAAVCLIASRKHLHAFCSAPEDLNVRARATTSLFQHTQPCVAGAIHHLRRIFISLVLLRQKEQAQQTSTAIDGLDRISKQIFFISINASVEAARAGEAGRGFLQISTDIRALSQSAQAATRDLSSLVADNRNQI
nr:methyl-accepting chemotaxis protein [Sulfitobacter aestuariivivens]